MSRVRAAARLDTAAFVALCALLLVMPSIEAPKTIALVFFVLLTVAGRLAERPLGLSKPDAIEWSLLALLAASAVSTAVNWPIANGLKGVADTAMYTAGCWCVYRGRWSDGRRSIVAAMVAAGVAAGLVRGVVDVYVNHKPFLEFHSAGIVTQSSIYLGMALVMAGGILVAPGGAGRRPGPLERTIWAVVVVVMLAGLALMASRGAILAVAVTWFLVLALVRRIRPAVATLVGIAVMVFVVHAAPDRFAQSRLGARITGFLTTFRLDDNDQLRVSMWRIGVARLSQGDAVVFGVGPRNFSSIDIPTLALAPPVEVPGQKLNHAHNLFVNKLVEEGVVGLAAFLLFLGMAAWRLARDRRRSRAVDWTWFAALGAILVPSIAGSFNTPWYQEHALLAMLLIGLYLSPRVNRDASHTGRLNGTPVGHDRAGSTDTYEVSVP